MSNLVINANSIYDRVIRIGRQTDNLVSEITFNVQMWIDEYGLGECVLNVRRNGDGSAYPVPMTITDGMTTWTITDTDTARKGRGEIQLKYTAGDKVKTSPIFTISCGESLIGDGEPPSGYDDWLTELNRMTAEVEAAKTSAGQSAQTAQTAAGTATEKATEAEQSATTASGFANNASASATSANTSAQAATQSAEQAAESVSDAEASAQEASASAQSAESAKQAAQTAESNAQGFAQTASTKASQAAESAEQAQESVTDAQAEATRARAEADRAKTYADRAAEVELEIPTKVSELENDAGYLTEHQSLSDYVRKDVLYSMLPTDSVNGSVASFPDGADDIPLKSLVVDIKPIQDTSSGDPSPDNICPISGWTGCGVTKTGKNLLDPTLLKDQAPWNTIKFYAPVGTKLTMSTNNSNATSATGLLCYFKAHEETNSSLRLVSASHPVTKIVPNDGYVEIVQRNPSGTISYDDFQWQVEVGADATSYEPYNGLTIPISWESEAGTIYGGKLDVLSGLLRITHSYTALPKTDWTLSGLNFYINFSVMSNTNPANLGHCTHYKSVPNITGNNTIIFGYSPFSTAPRIIVRDSRFTTAAEFMTYLQEQTENPVMISYPLAQPIEIQLDPHEVNSILGVNNIFADTGDTSVEYIADIQRYIDKRLSQ